jgi:hypothetical protein
VVIVGIVIGLGLFAKLLDVFCRQKMLLEHAQ